MEINKLTNRHSGSLNGPDSTGRKEGSSELGPSRKGGSPDDRVSINEYTFGENDRLFARTELQKLNQAGFDRLKSIKEELAEYRITGQFPAGTETAPTIGDLLEDPAVHDAIARKIVSS